MGDVYAELRTAIEKANVRGDAEFGYGQQKLSLAGTEVHQLRVQYSGGNEYLRLDMLLEKLSHIGELLLFELHGRGAEESPRLVAEVRVLGQIYQLIYYLPGDAASRDGV